MRHAAWETSNVALFYLNTLLTIFTISIFIAFSPYFLRSFSHPMASCLFLSFDSFFFKYIYIYIYFFFISFVLLHSYRSGWDFFFFSSFWWDLGTQNFPQQISSFFFRPISVPFSPVFIENHTSFPLTFAIVAHPWNSIYGEVLVVEIWTRG